MGLFCLSLRHNSLAEVLMNKIRRPHIKNRRRVFRLRLPAGSLLKATVNGKEYAVVEVSEFAFVVANEEVESLEGECRGTIHWYDDQSSEFTGEVGRLSESGRVIWNVHGISMSDMVKAQRQLIQRFPSRVLLRKTS